jgi:hypothetical protein
MNVSDMLGAQSAPLTILHEGKKYRAHPITQREKTDFERWLAQRVIGPFLAGQEKDERFAEAVGVVADRIALGRYSFHGEIALAVMKTPDGVFELARIVFGCTEEEILSLMAAKPKEVGSIVGMVFRQSFPIPAGAGEAAEQADAGEDADPNPPRSAS